MEHPVLTLLSQILGSTFSVSFISALAGAAGGALGAQRVIERMKRKDELLKELRNTNAAIMVAFTITNTTLAMKKQLVKPMQDRFNTDLAAFVQYRSERTSGMKQGNTPFTIQADIKTFLPPVIPTETLKTLIYERISAHGKPLSLVSLVEGAAVGLANSLEERRRLIAELKSVSPTDSEWIYRYLGERSPAGQTHREYADLTEVISSYTNDLLYFSAALATELVKHGEAVRSAFTEKYGKGAPNVSSPDFSGPRKTGLFPPESDYGSWSQWIVERADAATAREVVA
jgi:hypothetical protein